MTTHSEHQPGGILTNWRARAAAARKRGRFTDEDKRDAGQGRLPELVKAELNNGIVGIIADASKTFGVQVKSALDLSLGTS
jgi:hypothetical protein